MRNAILLSTLTALLPIAACATDDIEEDEITLELTDGSGKADDINGTQLRLRGSVLVASDRRAAGPMTMTVDEKTDRTTVARGDFVMVTGDDANEGGSFNRNKMLQVDIEGPANVTMGFVVRTGITRKVNCARGNIRRNVFRSFSVNMRDKEIYVDSRLTFTFAECGLTPAVRASDDEPAAYMLDFFALPIRAPGQLEGAYEYRLNIETI